MTIGYGVKSLHFARPLLQPNRVSTMYIPACAYTFYSALCAKELCGEGRVNETEWGIDYESFWFSGLV